MLESVRCMEEENKNHRESISCRKAAKLNSPVRSYMKSIQGPSLGIYQARCQIKTWYWRWTGIYQGFLQGRYCNYIGRLLMITNDNPKERTGPVDYFQGIRGLLSIKHRTNILINSKAYRFDNQSLNDNHSGVHSSHTIEIT